MTSIISDTELLELNIEPFEEEMQEPEDGPTTKTDQEFSQHPKESQNQQKLMGITHETERPFQRNEQQKEQQQTLKRFEQEIRQFTHTSRTYQAIVCHTRPNLQNFRSKTSPMECSGTMPHHQSTSKI